MAFDQVRLAEAHAAVDEERVVVVARLVGDRLRRRVRELVARADDEVVEGVLRQQRTTAGHDRPAGFGGGGGRRKELLLRGAAARVSVIGAAHRRWPASRACCSASRQRSRTDVGSELVRRFDDQACRRACATGRRRRRRLRADRIRRAARRSPRRSDATPFPYASRGSCQQVVAATKPLAESMTVDRSDRSFSTAQSTGMSARSDDRC